MVHNISQILLMEILMWSWPWWNLNGPAVETSTPAGQIFEGAVKCVGGGGGIQKQRGQRQAVMSRYNQALLLESLKFKIIQTSGLLVV